MTRLANLRRSFPTLMLLGAPFPTLKTIAMRKLKWHNVEEIGAALGTSTRTIDRTLRLIRAIWEEAAG
jgi:DNA-directed RNA polymerase specialized sigma24 family protein